MPAAVTQSRIVRECSSSEELPAVAVAPADLIEIRAEGTEQHLDENRVEQIHAKDREQLENGMP